MRERFMMAQPPKNDATVIEAGGEAVNIVKHHCINMLKLH